MYIIKKTTHEANIIYMEYDDVSYEVKNYTDGLKISNLCVYDKRFVPRVNDQLPFEYIFEILTKNVFDYLYSDEDDDDGTAGRLISEVDKTKAMLDSEYKEFLKRQDYYAYVDKISFLRDEIFNKIEINKYKQNLNQLITGRSR